MNTKILVVDDNAKNIRLLTDILEGEGYTVYVVDNGLTVLETVHGTTPDIILLDIRIPGLDGFEVCRLLKKDIDTRDIPVIMITAGTDSADIRKALEFGAFDYIKKPVDEGEVIARVQSALRLRQHMDKLKDIAMKDGLTGLYNHALLIELFGKEFIKHQRAGNRISFVMLDIDFFKKINDTYGHTAGDLVLKELSAILSGSVRKSDIIGRYGGEEFGLVLTETGSVEARRLCERIRRNVEGYDFHIENDIIHITISMGICIKEAGEGIDFNEMIKRADMALYKAKRNGRNRVEMYLDEGRSKI